VLVVNPDRVCELASMLTDEQRESITRWDVLIDPFGNEHEPTPLGHAVMDHIREGDQACL
jgi:hypothetical protein